MYHYVLGIYYLVMFLANKIRSKTSVNKYQGIRTVHSMRTDEHWQFTHDYLSKGFLVAGIVTLIITFIVSNYIDLADKKIPVILIQLIPFIIINAMTFKASKEFDEKYKEKLKSESRYKELFKLYPELKNQENL